MSKQHPADSFRQSFAEVVMLPVLREQIRIINDWMEDDQVEEVVKQLTASFPGTSLIQNNRHVFARLMENTCVAENRRTGEKSPTVRFVDFGHRDNNRFIAVCQPKVRMIGTEHHIVPDIVLFLNGVPVVVIECKSPKVKDAIPEATDQLLRYSEGDVGDALSISSFAVSASGAAEPMAQLLLWMPELAVQCFNSGVEGTEGVAVDGCRRDAM